MFDHSTPREALPNASILPLSAEGLRLVLAGRTLVDIERLALSSGGPTMILGPNGAGKSLLMRLLHGLIVPTAGRIQFNGKPVGAIGRKRHAMVFQRPVLLRRSVAANVEYVLRVHGVPVATRKQRVQSLLGEAGLADKARQPARTLSFGEQQRLALIRALSTEPEVLFLDEPTSSLDPQASAMIEDLILRASQRGTKIIMITHELGQVQRLGTEVVFMNKGRIVEVTPAAEFLTMPRSTPAQHYVAGELLI